MARTISMKEAVHGSTANTTIPSSPVQGVAYRKSTAAVSEMNPGWPFSTIVDSAIMNEVMYRVSGLVNLLEKGGILEWSALTNYPINGIVKGADGIVYQALLASGPDEGVGTKDCSAGANPTFWNVFASEYGNPAGGIIAVVSSTVPDGFLECNGASLLRATYSDLFTAIGTTYGNADGTHFNIPDYRGKFLRGWDHGAGNDPDAATRTDRGDGTGGDVVGSKQADALQNIAGTWAGSVQNDWTNTYTGAFYNKVDASVSVDRGDIGTANNALGFDASLVARTSSETRPANINIMYCIKY